nr:GGDEF domain-containing protein [Nitrosomonas sp.]
MQEAIKQKQRRLLRLVKSSGATKIDQKSVIDSDDYYQQVERYAEQIRKTSSADEIISILDIV